MKGLLDTEIFFSAGYKDNKVTLGQLKEHNLLSAEDKNYLTTDEGFKIFESAVEAFLRQANSNVSADPSRESYEKAIEQKKYSFYDLMGGGTITKLEKTEATDLSYFNKMIGSIISNLILKETIDLLDKTGGLILSTEDKEALIKKMVYTNSTPESLLSNRTSFSFKILHKEKYYQFPEGMKITKMLSNLLKYEIFEAYPFIEEKLIGNLFIAEKDKREVFVSIDPTAFIAASFIGNSCYSPGSGNQHAAIANIGYTDSAVVHNSNWTERAYLFIDNQSKVFSIAKTYPKSNFYSQMIVVEKINSLGYELVDLAWFSERENDSEMYFDTTAEMIFDSLKPREERDVCIEYSAHYKENILNKNYPVEPGFIIEWYYNEDGDERHVFFSADVSDYHSEQECFHTEEIHHEEDCVYVEEIDQYVHYLSDRSARVAENSYGTEAFSEEVKDFLKSFYEKKSLCHEDATDEELDREYHIGFSLSGYNKRNFLDNSKSDAFDILETGSRFGQESIAITKETVKLRDLVLATPDDRYGFIPSYVLDSFIGKLAFRYQKEIIPSFANLTFNSEEENKLDFLRSSFYFNFTGTGNWFLVKK